MNAKEVSRASGESPGASRQDRLLHSALLGTFAALLAATPLLPSDTYSLAMEGSIAAPAMLWMVLAICATFAWLLKAMKTPGLAVEFSLTDILFAIFFVWVPVAGVITSGDENRRAGWNMAATWATLGITYYLGRMLLRDSRAVRAMVVGIAAVGLMFSIEGLYEGLVTIPKNQAEFKRNPQAMLSEAGIEAQPGTAVYDQFKSRLETQGPFATFALENSFAGFLTPVIPLALALWLSTGRRKDSSDTPPRGAIGSTMIVTTVGFTAGAIYFTQSNAAMLATAIAIFVGGIAIFWSTESRMARYGVIAFVALLFLWPIAVGFVNAAAPQSLPLTLKYRAEYWRSCAALFLDHPFLGCGPGNFQDLYAYYKLPQASETIADPHNWFWDVLCNSGLPAIAFFLGGLAMAVGTPIRQFLGKRGDPSNGESEQARKTGAPLAPLAIGGVIGVPLALLLSLASGSSYLRIFLPMFLLFGVVPAAALLWGLWRWIQEGELSAGAIWSAWLALAIHLTVSGGISNPGAGTLLFLLPALALNDASSPTYRIRGTAFVGVVGIAVLCGIALAHYRFGYVPVLASQGAVNRAESALLIDDRGEAKTALRDAADVDPWSSTSLSQLAMLELQTYLQDAAESPRAEPAKLVLIAKEAVERSPKSPSLHFEMAMTLLRAHTAAPKPELLHEAKVRLERATELAPTRAMGFAYLAYVDALAGEMELAKKCAREALRLDSLNPHEQYDLGLEPSPIPGRSFPGWLEELAPTRLK